MAPVPFVHPAERLASLVRPCAWLRSRKPRRQVPRHGEGGHDRGVRDLGPALWVVGTSSAVGELVKQRGEGDGSGMCRGGSHLGGQRGAWRSDMDKLVKLQRETVEN